MFRTLSLNRENLWVYKIIIYEYLICMSVCFLFYINILTTTWSSIYYHLFNHLTELKFLSINIYSSHSSLISVSESVKFWFIKPAKRYFLHEDMWLQSFTWSRWCWTCRVCWRPSWWRSGLPSPWRREQCAARQILRILQSQYLLSKYLNSTRLLTNLMSLTELGVGEGRLYFLLLKSSLVNWNV